MTSRVRLIAFGITVFLLTTFNLQAQDELTAANLEDRHIQAAIRALVNELYHRRDEKIHWEPGSFETDFLAKQRGGFTALSVLALLYAGESYQDPRLRDAVAFLESLPMIGTYAVSVRANVWAMLPARFETLLNRDRQWLLEGFSERAAGWNYEKEPYTNRRDNSITQYGTLALWEAAKRGQRIDNRYWRMLEERFIAMQLADGGWNYTGDGPATGSMTAAGLMVLFVTQDFLHAAEQVRPQRNNDTAAERALARGLDWMSRNFSPDTNPGRDTDFYYYLYGVERVALASGYKFFGERDWYREGAAELIRRFCAVDPHDGSMSVHQRIGGNPRAGTPRTIDLSFALMFLSRGRVPVAINKLSGLDLRWNNRPRDVANAVQMLTEASEQALNWQIVDLALAPEDWLDAPLLYLALDEPPAWIKAVESNPAAPLPDPLQRLKRYIDLGGTLFVNIDGRNRAAAQAVESAGAAMYPGFAWRALPADHWVYTLYKPVTGNRPELKALSNGVRELMIVSSAVDFGETLQTRQTRRTQDWDTLANLYLYASERNGNRPRLETHSLTRRTRGATLIEQVTIARVRHQGAWNAEPLALEVLSTWLWNEIGLDARVQDVDLNALAELNPRPTLAIISGIDPVAFSEPERNALERYVRAGGRVIFETTGGHGDFATEAELLCRDLFKESARSARRHRALTGEGLPGGRSLLRVEYRPHSFEVFGARETAPRLRAMTIDDEARLFFTREDLLHGVLNQPIWGVSGYVSIDARQLLANLLLDDIIK